MIAKEDYQQAVNAKNRFAHFPWSRPTLGTLDDFEAVSRGQWTRYQIRITARGRRGTRRTKHGSKTHLSSPTLIEPRPATLKWDATLSIRIDQHILRRARSRSLATHPPPPPPPPPSIERRTIEPFASSNRSIRPRRDLRERRLLSPTQGGIYVSWLTRSCGPPCGPFSRRVWSR